MWPHILGRPWMPRTTYLWWPTLWLSWEASHSRWYICFVSLSLTRHRPCPQDCSFITHLDDWRSCRHLTKTVHPDYQEDGVFRIQPIAERDGSLSTLACSKHHKEDTQYNLNCQTCPWFFSKRSNPSIFYYVCTAGLNVLFGHTQNQFAVRPRGLRWIWIYEWKALDEAHPMAARNKSYFHFWRVILKK